MQTKTLILPARSGWRWIAEGYRIYGKNRLMLALMVVGCWMLMMLVGSYIPKIGGLIATICLPAMSVGLMSVCRRLERDEVVVPATLFSGFSENPGRLLSLGVMYILVVVLVLGTVALIDGGRFFRVFLMGAPLEASSANPLATWVLLLLMLPVAMAYWYAPMLVAWHGHSVGKSLFFSLFACLRNWRAIIVYVCALFMLMVLLGIFSGMLASWLPEGLRRSAGSLPALLLMFFLGMPVLYASFYVSYCDVFAAGSGEHA